ncbi:MAG: tetratricopeptide repeat-containing sulfotransferase family protein [Steroidobacteraceae bacterium]
MTLFQRGQFDAAAACSRKALKTRPAHLGALNLLGVSLNALGEYAKASQIFAELGRRDSKNANHWMNLGTSLRAQRRYEESLAAYAQAGGLGEASADFFYNVGLVHFDMGNFEAARTVLHDAVRLAPEDGEISYQYAVCCFETMRLKDAVAVLDSWPRMRGLTTDLLTKIGLLLMNLGELQSAGRAVELASRDPRPDGGAVLRMIQVQERTNRVAEARIGLARLKSDPRSASLGTDVKVVEARLAEREGRPQEAHDLYVELLAATRDFHLRHHYLFPLAKTLDVLGRHDQAFAALEEAHRSQVTYLKLATPNAAARRGPLFRIADFGCDSADVAGWDQTGAPAAVESPTFILGFPRSGTTLLEQTLDAHGSLASMDETTFLHDVIDRMISEGIEYPRSLAVMNRSKADEMRSFYWTLVRRKIRLKPGQSLVDKNPLNLLALPAIRRLFPNSRILLAIRHPCDVILSCYMQQFRAPDFTLLCRDLATLAAGYRRAFDFWYREAAILQPAVREVRYETLVTEFEPQVRAIAEFLDLDWTDAMLEPGQHASRKGFISTPSYSQVVQPVHARSVSRWKDYEKRFAEVVPQVQPYLDRWEYDT